MDPAVRTLPALSLLASRLGHPPKPQTIVCDPRGRQRLWVLCHQPSQGLAWRILRGLEGLCGCQSTPGSPGLTCPLRPEKPTSMSSSFFFFRDISVQVSVVTVMTWSNFLIASINRILSNPEFALVALFLSLSSYSPCLQPSP